MSSIILNRIKEKKYVLIAEIGVNYYDIAKKEKITNLEAAKKMINAAKNSGVHAVKFQTYKAETLSSKYSPAYWDLEEEQTKSQYELFKKFDSFKFEEYQELKKYCDECEIAFLSTPFDFESADYLEKLMDVYKISSSDMTNIPFIKYQAKKGKPILLSTGASNYEEILNAVETIRNINDEPLILLHCVLEYPTPYEDANLEKITMLRMKFPDCVIGYSDHTKPDKNFDIIKTAYNLGALVIEKHFTLDKTLKGNDHYHAMNPEDAKKIIEELNFIRKIRGCGDLVSLKTEKKARLNARRSVVSLVEIKKGTIIKEEMLTFKRPGTGISPDKVEEIIGYKAKADIEKDQIIKGEIVEKR